MDIKKLEKFIENNFDSICEKTGISTQGWGAYTVKPDSLCGGRWINNDISYMFNCMFDIIDIENGTNIGVTTTQHNEKIITTSSLQRWSISKYNYSEKVRYYDFEYIIDIFIDHLKKSWIKYNGGLDIDNIGDRLNEYINYEFENQELIHFAKNLKDRINNDLYDIDIIEKDVSLKDLLYV